MARLGSGWIALAAPLLAAGCSLNPGLEDPETLAVLFQMCVPGQVVRFKDVEAHLEAKNPGERDVARQWIPGSGPGEVERPSLRFGEVMNRKGILSEGIGGIRLMGNTVKDQPAFESLGEPPENYIAISARLQAPTSSSNEYVTYWFKLPRAISEADFSGWIEPVSEEDRAVQDRQKSSTSWNLLNGRPMELHKVGPGAPKMRVKLVAFRDYAELNRIWDRTRDALVQKYSAGMPPGPGRERLLFVPKRDAAIPAC